MAGRRAIAEGQYAPASQGVRPPDTVREMAERSDGDRAWVLRPRNRVHPGGRLIFIIGVSDCVSGVLAMTGVSIATAEWGGLEFQTVRYLSAFPAAAFCALSLPCNLRAPRSRLRLRLRA